jgi:hypothetical protein
MNTAWTRMLAVGLLLCPIGCEVHVNDDPDYGYGGDFGDGGTGGTSGNGGRVGSSGNAGRGGSDVGGSGGDVGGSGGTEAYPAPTCAAEPGDEQDPCAQCLKRSCCEEWLDCDDDACFQEWTGVSDCVSMVEFPDSTQYGECVSYSSAADDGLPQSNTEALLSCANEPNPSDDPGSTLGQTRCGIECFGNDIDFSN